MAKVSKKMSWEIIKKSLFLRNSRSFRYWGEEV